jgi:hypothetical protein
MCHKALSKRTGAKKMPFTEDNTAGYTAEQLEALNAELAERLKGIEDPDQREAVEKAFADEVARR